MTATQVSGQGPALPGRLARSLRGAALAGASVAGVSAAGALVSVRAAYPRPPRAAPPEGWPPPRPVPQGRLTVAVVLGASGSVITDALGPYEVFARSPEFFVYTVSAGPAAMLSGGLAVVPDYSLGDVDAGTAPEPDVVVIPAVVSPAGSKERPLREWLARRAGRGAHLLGVCAGSRLLAAAGLLDGHRATSHWSRLKGLQRSRPQVDWVRGQRYVQDGKITTTAGVTSGVFGALRLVQQLTGATEAQRVGRELAYPGWSLDGPTGIPAQRPAPRDLTNLLAALAPWRRPAVGVGLAEGVGELDVAAPFEVYASSFAARTVPIAAGRTVTTRHGLRLIAAPADATAPRVDRLIVPGVHSLDEVGPRLAGWAAERGLCVELLQADGEFSFDAMLHDLAAHADRATARVTAKSIEYPTGHLRLAGAGVDMAAHHPARPDHRSRHRRRFPPSSRRPPEPAMTPTHETGPLVAHPLRAPVLWGLVWGLIQAASPLGFWWLDPATVYALSLALIAAVYIGFAVADGRPRIVAIEAAVAGLFVVAAAAAVTGPAWLLVLGFTGHGLKDLWQHHHHYVANTRWWPPFCLVVDWVAAAILVLLIATGVHFHH